MATPFIGSSHVESPVDGSVGESIDSRRKTGDMTEHKLSGRLKFDVEELYGVAPRFTQSGEWVDNAVRDATDTLLGLGNFWGNDKPGTAFGNTYQVQQDMILKILGVISGDLEGVAEGIGQMAKNYGVTEDGLSSKIRKLNNEM
jgi:hypothetical protein